MQVQAAFATNRFSWWVMVHSTQPIVWPRRMTLSSALRCACHGGRKELFFRFNRGEGFLRSESTCKRPCPSQHQRCRIESLRATFPLHLHAVVRPPDRRPSVRNLQDFRLNKTKDHSFL